jgi:hypothetical protein
MHSVGRIAGAGLIFIAASTAMEAQKPRARDLGIPFEGTPGQWNPLRTWRAWKWV